MSGAHVPGTTPYAWPYDGCLDPRRTALVVAGAQRSWEDACADPAPWLEVIGALAPGLRRLGVLVVRLRGRGPAGRDPGDPWIPVAADHDVEAAGIDGFFGGPLDGVLRGAGRDHLVLAGLGLEAPVHSTLRSANDRGYECLTLADASAPLDAACGAAALSTITMSGGIFGAIGRADALLAALASGPTDQEEP